LRQSPPIAWSRGCRGPTHWRRPRPFWRRAAQELQIQDLRMPDNRAASRLREERKPP